MEAFQHIASSLETAPKNRPMQDKITVKPRSEERPHFSSTGSTTKRGKQTKYAQITPSKTDTLADTLNRLRDQQAQEDNTCQHTNTAYKNLVTWR